MDQKKLLKQLNLFKTISVTSTLILIGAVTFIFTQRNETYFKDPDGNTFQVTQEMLGELYAFNEVISISDSELVDEWEQDNVNIDSVTTGRKIRLRDAAAKRDSFHTWNKKKFNFVKEITPFGFAFGKHRLRKMLSEIDSTNRALTRLKKQDSLIYGVRTYLTFSRNKQGKKSRHLDLLFVPIMQNGKTYYSLKKPNPATKSITTEGDPMLLNTSSPCPKMCDE